MQHVHQRELYRCNTNSKLRRAGNRQDWRPNKSILRQLLGLSFAAHAAQAAGKHQVFQV